MKKPRAKIITLRGAAQKAAACDLINENTDSPLMEVVLRAATNKRSTAQNRLYRLWLTAITKTTGQPGEDLHRHLKGEYLSGIYERDFPDYADEVNDIRVVFTLPGQKLRALRMRARLIDHGTSTTRASVEQFSEYLGKVELEARDLGVNDLPDHELHNLAMGSKNSMTD